MHRLSERIVIYSALSLLCAMTAAAVDPAAAALSFVQVVAVIELIYWLARPAEGVRHDAGH